MNQFLYSVDLQIKDTSTYNALSYIFIDVMCCLFSYCRFIRREKEIAETRFEVAQVESLRYRQRVEHLERELQELQDSLNAEREKVQVWLGIIAYEFKKQRGLFCMFWSLSLLTMPVNEILEESGAFKLGLLYN